MIPPEMQKVLKGPEAQLMSASLQVAIGEALKVMQGVLTHQNFHSATAVQEWHAQSKAILAGPPQQTTDATGAVLWTVWYWEPKKP